MRRINSDFRTKFMSEAGQKLVNRDYFGFVEMDDFACYVLADSLDSETKQNSAQIAVESVIRCFSDRPSMRKGKLRRCLREAHEDLLKLRQGMHLKASVVLVVTDYKKLRYAYVGNSRMYLFRSGKLFLETVDQSLAENLLEDSLISKDQVQRHEERNNLYSFLGGRKRPKSVVSGKIKLEDGDVFELLSRGVWENCSDDELTTLTSKATTPEELLDGVEDLILGKQETDAIDNYTMAATFVDKVYRNPRKPISWRKVLAIAIPLIIIIGGISFALWFRHRSIVKKQEALTQAMESGQTYLDADNYDKASQQYEEASKLAKSLKKPQEQKDADSYLKVSQQILLADGALASKEYEKAQQLYQAANELPKAAGNVGRDYIEARLSETNDYMEVFDLIDRGMQQEENGDLEGAAKTYEEARALASSVYFTDGRAEAKDKLTAVQGELDQIAQESKADSEKASAAQKESQDAADAKLAEDAAKQLQEEQKKQELENLQKENDRKAAIDLESKGNDLFAAGKYTEAITYYRTAQSIYTRLELPELAVALDERIEAANVGKKAADELAKQQAASEAAQSQAAQTQASGTQAQTGQTKGQAQNQTTASNQTTVVRDPRWATEVGPGVTNAPGQ